MTKASQRLTDSDVKPLGMFAVMLNRAGVKKMHCAALHATREEAKREAERLTAAKIEQQGADVSFCFYVLEIVGQVGFVQGKLRSTGKHL